MLDLRDNGGGLVTEAQLVVEHVLCARRDRHDARAHAADRRRSARPGDPIAPTIPLAVLVNGDTASAAEIVTGALQDHHRAVIVGTRTYGKGVFQEIRPLSNGGAIDITVGQYFLPERHEPRRRRPAPRRPASSPNVVVSRRPSAQGDPQLAGGAAGRRRQGPLSRGATRLPGGARAARPLRRRARAVRRATPSGRGPLTVDPARSRVEGRRPRARRASGRRGAAAAPRSSAGSAAPTSRAT